MNISAMERVRTNVVPSGLVAISIHLTQCNGLQVCYQCESCEDNALIYHVYTQSA
ncbi:MAG: hypothetical protein ACLTK0_04100 [Anaerovoracaceae bacterium]